MCDRADAPAAPNAPMRRGHQHPSLSIMPSKIPKQPRSSGWSGTGLAFACNGAPPTFFPRGCAAHDTPENDRSCRRPAVFNKVD